MKYILLLAVIFACVSFKTSPRAKPVSVILDTDIGPDYDDVGALAVLHALADKGETKILATISCNAYETAAPTLSVLNTYYHREQIPVGVSADQKHSYLCPRLWAQGIIAKYPHRIKSNNEAIEAVKLYRKILAAQKDSSVVVISIGPFTNLANLLNSGADEFSKLNGVQLVGRKVKRLVAMAGAIDSTGRGGYESNVTTDIPAAQLVFKKWPGQIIISGFEIGRDVFTGMKLINNAAIQNSPVKDAYAISIKYDGSKIGRYSWDQTAVIAGVRGINSYFNYRWLNFTIKDDGKDTIMTGKRIKYLSLKQKPEVVAKAMEDLMMKMPSDKINH